MFPLMHGKDIQLKMTNYFGSLKQGRKKVDGVY